MSADVLLIFLTIALALLFRFLLLSCSKSLSLFSVSTVFRSLRFLFDGKITKSDFFIREDMDGEPGTTARFVLIKPV